MEKTIEELIEEALKDIANLVLNSEVSTRIIMPHYRTDEENAEAAKIRYSEQELKENFLRKVEKESEFYYSVETPSKKVYSISNSEKPAVKVEKAKELKVQDVIAIVYKALSEKGYNPVNQIVGYIMSGDPTYITSHNNARSLIMKVERDEILEELMKVYVDTKLR